MTDYQRVQALPGWAAAIAPYSPAFQKAILFCLAHENEYHPDGTVRTEYDPHDSGGTTRYGIDRASHPDVDVTNLTLSGAVRSYHHDEWSRAHGEDLPEHLAIAHFDGTVNMGVHPSAQQLQLAIGANPDGSLGPATIAAAKTTDGVVVGRMLDRRVAYYKGLKNFPRYGRGWLNRVADLRQYLDV